LAEVDDVDAVALAEDVLLHLRVPALGLVSEVDASLEQVLQRDAAQAALPLPFAELEALARPLLPVLLAFLDPRVARQEAFLLQPRPQLEVVLDQRARDAEPQRAGLAGDAAAGDRREDVELVGGLGDASGCLIWVRSASVGKACSRGLRLTVMPPLPGRRNTRAVDVLRRPVP
jgi:hypothetical protein